MTLDALTIEAGLQERWEQHGHNVTYKYWSVDGSILMCGDCRLEVELHVNDLGGWWIDKQHLDRPCVGETR